MKVLFLLIVLTLISCGRYEVTGGSAGQLIGNVKAVTATALSQSDINQMKAICQALVAKSAILSQAQNNIFKFRTTQNNCDGSAALNSDLDTNIVQNGSDFIFKKTDGSNYIFPSVETDTNGMMQPICANINNNNLSSPIISPSGTGIWFTLNASSADCPRVSGETCIMIESASLQNGSYVVNSVDIARFRVSSPTNSLIGFFTLRKKTSKSICGNNQSITSSATLL